LLSSEEREAHNSFVLTNDTTSRNIFYLFFYVALDPAGLFYRGQKAIEEKLDEADAEFVEVIHTNMGQLGLEGKLGHADFYPNGGRTQERCYMFSNPIAMIAEQVSGNSLTLS